MKLPESMLKLADLSSNEEAWKPGDFPEVLELATKNSLACIGGQFQFRGVIGTAEMYWVDADSEERKSSESWLDYVERANTEVLEEFRKRMSETDFDQEALGWSHISQAVESGLVKDPKEYLYFVAYFCSDPDGVEQAAGGDAPR